MSRLRDATGPRPPGLGAILADLVGMGGLAFTLTIL